MMFNNNILLMKIATSDRVKTRNIKYFTTQNGDSTVLEYCAKFGSCCWSVGLGETSHPDITIFTNSGGKEGGHYLEHNPYTYVYMYMS